MIALLFGGAVPCYGHDLSIHKKWNFTRYYAVENHREMVLPLLMLLIIADEEATIRAHQGTIERPAITCKFL